MDRRSWSGRVVRTIGAFGLIVVVFGVTAADAQQVRYVDASASGMNDGTGWTDAFDTLQAALSVAQAGDEVWVASGTYTPGPPGDAESSFLMANGVALYGGFDGSETSLDQRDWSTNITMLSGDVGQDDVYGSPWYSGWDMVTPNSAQVLTGSGTNGTAVLDGFTVMAGATGPAGTPAGSPYMYGGGMYNVGGSPTIRNCTFTRNLAAFGHGGGIYSHDGSPTIENCRFIENYVHLGSGGGIYISGGSQPTITDCVFQGNIVVTSSGGGEGQGAGIGSTSTLPIELTGCTFEYNVGRSFYSCCPTEIARGGGVSSFLGGLTLQNCVFRHNRAHAGGGLYTWGDTLVVNCEFFDNHADVVAMSGGVDGGGFAGGVGSASFASDVTTLVNCVVARNHAQEAAGIDTLFTHHTVLESSIVWDNLASGQDVDPRDRQYKGSTDVFYSCVQDLLTAPPGEDPYDPDNYPGSIVDDPTFEDLLGGDLHLTAQSPCIDAGDNIAVPAGVVTDLDGLPRFHDDPATPDTGNGVPPLVDMGTYEYRLTAPADTDGDGVPDEIDNCPGDYNPGQADCDSDGMGDVCAIDSGAADDCNTNSVPDSCDLVDGTSSDTNGNGVPDECETVVAPPLPEDSLALACSYDAECANTAACVAGRCYVPKNRYVSIDPNPANAGLSTARRVSLDLGGGQSVVLGWLGSPQPVNVTGPEASPQLLGRLVDEAARHYRDWSVDDMGQPWVDATVHLGDCEVSPGQTYLIQSITDGADIHDGANYSQPLVLTTQALYGDVVGGNTGTPPDGDRSFKDISAVVRGFQSSQTEPKVWLDLQGTTQAPEIPAFSDISFSDIDQAVKGFQGQGYPYAFPCECPGQICP